MQVLKYVLSNFDDLENSIHFGIFLLQLGEKTYFLTLGMITVTGVGFIGKKITEGLYGQMPTNIFHLIISLLNYKVS